MWTIPFPLNPCTFYMLSIVKLMSVKVLTGSNTTVAAHHTCIYWVDILLQSRFCFRRLANVVLKGTGELVQFCSIAFLYVCVHMLNSATTTRRKATMKIKMLKQINCNYSYNPIYGTVKIHIYTLYLVYYKKLPTLYI